MAELIENQNPDNIINLRLLPVPDESATVKSKNGAYEFYFLFLNKAKRDYNTAVIDGRDKDLEGLMFNVLSAERSMDNFLAKALNGANLDYEHDQRLRK